MSQIRCGDGDNRSGRRQAGLTAAQALVTLEIYKHRNSACLDVWNCFCEKKKRRCDALKYLIVVVFLEGWGDLHC